MAKSWGNSWANAWGNSWGFGSTVPIKSGGKLRKPRRKPQTYGDFNGLAPDDARMRKIRKQNAALLVALQ